MSRTHNQFYKDNAPNYDEFIALSSLFEGLTDVFDEMMSQAIDNSKLSTMRAFTKIPIQIINVVDACYSLPTLLTNKEVLNITGIDPSLSVQERMNIWNGLNPKIRAAALDQLGFVLMLVNPNTLKGENFYTDTFKVIDFEMYDYNTGDRLICGIDYYYEYNKIYFLRFGSQTNKYNNKKIILKNITVDNNMPEKILGESLGIYANSNFSPIEYRDVISSFASAALAGPVINRINQSFNPDTALNLAARTYGLNDDENSLKGIRIVDYKSADELKRRFWEQKVDGITRLNTFDFLVTIPSDYLYKIEKIEYVYEFIKKIKPAQTSFVLNPEYLVRDVFSARYANHIIHSEGRMDKVIDNIEYEEANHKIAYLNCLTKMHAGRTPYHLSDEVLLDTDWFDSAILFEDFHVLTTGTFYDKAPELETSDINLDSTQFALDKGDFEDDTKKFVIFDFFEQVNYIHKYKGDYSICTDVGVLLDSLHIDDTNIISEGYKSLSDNINKIEAKYSILLKANNMYDKLTSAEKNTKIAYLNCLTRVHVKRSTHHSSDEVLLDTDWFDQIILLDDFSARIKGVVYDKAPKLITRNFKAVPHEHILDKKSLKDNTKELAMFNLGEKIHHIYNHSNDYGIEADSEILLDVAYINDANITSETLSSISDTIRKIETIDSMLLKADNMYDKLISKESNAKVMYLDCITAIHVRRNTHHSSDEVLLDTDWFDQIILLDDFSATTKGTFYDKAPKLTTQDFKMTWIRDLTDKKSLNDETNKIAMLTFGTKVNYVYKRNNNYGIYSDAGVLLDVAYMSDIKVSSTGFKGLVDKLNRKIDKHSLSVGRNINERIKSKEVKKFASNLSAKDKLSSLESVVSKLNKSVKDNIKSKEAVDSMSLKADNVYDKINSEENPKGRSVTATKDKLSASDNIVRSPKQSIHDHIKSKETIDSMSLKTDSVYDKIISRENAKGCSITSKTDSLSFVTKANITKCDSIYECDYAAETGFRLDSHDGFYENDNSIGYEVVSIKLIPKN